VKPALTPDALHGIARDLVTAIEPHSEADPAALLFDFLAEFVNAVGSEPHFRVGGAAHRARLFVVIVGRTARARKGQAHAEIETVMRLADPIWHERTNVTGLSTGEGLIAALADPTGDEPPRDRRLMIYEPEFAKVLKVATREGNILSPTLRQAWDTGTLSVITKSQPLKATGTHIGVVGNITTEELRAHLGGIDIANGMANRHLWVAAERSKVLPHGGNPNADYFDRLGYRVANALASARNIGQMHRDNDATKLWSDLYHQIADNDLPGLYGALTARAEAQVLRLSMAYALLDGTDTITEQHVRSGWAAWQYADASVTYIFGDDTGDPVQERILTALAKNPESGLSRTAISDLFGRNLSRRELDRAVDALVDAERIEVVVDRTGSRGRPRELIFLRTNEKNETNEESKEERNVA
jgi:hypothetical protein